MNRNGCCTTVALTEMPSSLGKQRLHWAAVAEECALLLLLFFSNLLLLLARREWCEGGQAAECLPQRSG